jgi:hypothetical protein
MPSGLCWYRCRRRRRGGAARAGIRCGAWSTVRVTGRGWGVRGGTFRTGTGRGGGCMRCSPVGRCWGVGTDRVRADRRRGRAGQAVLAGVSGLDHCPGARARRRARRDSVNLVAGEPDHHALDRSRGGWSTKTHLAVDQRRGVISFLLTPGQAGDSPQMIGVLERIRVMHPAVAGPVPVRTGFWPTRPTPRAPPQLRHPLRQTRRPLRRDHTSPSSTTGFDDLRNRP